ncbi:hypothetical protein RhiLY_02815 [Ceratobasidium sp. AG-Ba]|nr:hypothetical protein RhiLY_02815 [Ceratobasidium sp. AG-Ba]
MSGSNRPEIISLDFQNWHDVHILPLQSLKLVGVSVSKPTLVYFEQLAKICPRLCQLEVADTEIGLADLCHITHYLKELEHLSITVIWNETAPNPTYSSESLVTLECNDAVQVSQKLNAQTIAVYLSTIWPNLRSLRSVNTIMPTNRDRKVLRQLGEILSKQTLPL